MISMGNQSFHQMSANSNNLKNFNLQQKFKTFVLLVIIAVPFIVGILLYLNHKEGDNPLNIPVSVVSSQLGSQKLSDDMIDIVASIENNGINSSKHLSAGVNTDVLSNGTVIKFDESTWFSPEPGTGTMNATLTVNGVGRDGVINFELINGTWMITGYSFV